MPPQPLQQSHFCYLVGKLQGPWKLPCWSLPVQTRKRVHCTLGWLGRWLLSTRGTCGEEKLWVRVLPAVTRSFFPLTTITQRSTLGPPRHAARLNLQCNRNFHRASFSDHCNTLCKAALFQSTESTDCSRGSQGFATLLPYLQPGVLLLCAKASSHCCISVTFSIALLQLGLLSIFTGVKQNRIQTIDPQSRGKENHTCFSLSFHGFQHSEPTLQHLSLGESFVRPSTGFAGVSRTWKCSIK